jgi:hypothetical protein
MITLFFPAIADPALEGCGCAHSALEDSWGFL